MKEKTINNDLYIDLLEVEEVLGEYYNLAELTETDWERINTQVVETLKERGLYKDDVSSLVFDEYDEYMAVVDGAISAYFEERKGTTNVEMLVNGIAEIASAHGLHWMTDYRNEGDVCIWGGLNVPTLADVQMLCDDVKMPRNCIGTCEFGIDVYVSEEWLNEVGAKRYEKGLELWRVRR